MYIKQKILSLSLSFFFGWEMMSDSGYEQPRSKKVTQEREGVKGCFQASCDCGQTEICLDEEIWEAESSLEISFNWAETVGKFSTHSICVIGWEFFQCQGCSGRAEFAEATRKEERLGAAWQVLSISYLCL